LVAQLHGSYEVLEYNASDARGQAVIKEMAEGIADNTTISFGSGGGQAKVKGLCKRACIIMDEVDGMGAGDRGGNAALIKMIKKTRNPIICICNDQHSPKVRSLAFSCYDLKFTRPQKAMIAQRCAEIAKREGFDVEPNALETLAESCGGDLRMILNQMQMLARSPLYRTSGVKYLDMKEKLKEMSKDQSIMLTGFDACKKLLNSSESSRLTFRERLDMFFVDFSLVGLLVQENYLKSVEKRGADLQTLNRCAYSADLMTIGDMVNKRINSGQEWGMLPDMGVVSATYPAWVTNGFVAFPSFPAFLGKYSTMSRTRRLSLELQAHLRLSGNIGKSTLVTTGYADLLYKRMVSPLMRNEAGNGIDQTVGILDAYGLRKEHLTEHLTELREHLGGEDLFKVVDPKVKAAMTREMNGGGHAMKVVLPTGKRRRASAEEANPDDADEDNEHPAEAEQAEGSDDDTGGALVKVKGKAQGKAKAKAKSKSARTTGTGDTDASPGPAPKAKAKGRAKKA
jgi:replication factor C subunit 1